MRSPEDFPADDCFKRAKEQDAKCRAVFGPTWSMEQAADLFRLLDAERLSATERAAKKRYDSYGPHIVLRVPTGYRDRAGER
jgi:hypothetical protein